MENELGQNSRLRNEPWAAIFDPPPTSTGHGLGIMARPESFLRIWGSDASVVRVKIVAQSARQERIKHVVILIEKVCLLIGRLKLIQQILEAM